MKTGIKAALILLALIIRIQGQGLAYTDSAMVSLLTCSPGSELYSKFGHSAIRVYDPYAGVDIVYNYGLFDFNTPNFYLKFIRGKLPYQLGVQRFYSFMWDYQSEGRKVEEIPEKNCWISWSTITVRRIGSTLMTFFSTTVHPESAMCWSSLRA